MKLLLIVLGIVASVSLAQAQSGGTPTNPLYVREHQGTTRTYAEVSCTVAGNVALIAAASTANARSILLSNESGVNAVVICPVAAAAGVCDAAAEGLTLWPKGALPIDRSVRDTAWSCQAFLDTSCTAAAAPVSCCTGAGTGTCTTVIVGILIEK